ncbi:MAG: OadG family protein [Chloroflexi bacterium]|nr:OadG family protein [Chloroflexota bacterium]
MADGIIVTIAGMGIVFATLIILVIVMTGLERLFRSTAPAEEPSEELSLEEQQVPEGETIAAIAAALTIALAEDGKPAVARPIAFVRAHHPAASGWRSFGRERQMRSRLP